MKKGPFAGPFHGASRTRTGDLLGAILALYAARIRMMTRFLLNAFMSPNTFPNILRPVLQ
jgi:hypothetical protein